MAERRPVTTTTTTAASIKKEKSKTPQLPLFEKDNMVWMIIGAVVIALGMILMSGGKSDNPNHFDYNSVYSTTRITIAPILILIGFAIEIYAIFKRPKVHQQ